MMPLGSAMRRFRVLLFLPAILLAIDFVWLLIRGSWTSSLVVVLMAIGSWLGARYLALTAKQSAAASSSTVRQPADGIPEGESKPGADAGPATGVALAATSMRAIDAESGAPVERGRPDVGESIFGQGFCALGLLLAVVTQAILVYLPEGLKLPPSYVSALQPIWPHSAQVVYACGLGVAGMVAFALGTRVLIRQMCQGLEAERFPSWSQPLPVLPVSLLMAAGFLNLCWVLLKLSTTAYDPMYARWYAVAILLLLSGLAWGERDRFAQTAEAISALGRSRLLEAGFVVATLALFLYLSVFDLGSWYYSALGDEHAFFFTSRQMAQGQVFNLFSQNGTYGIIPYLSSYFEGKVMQLVGISGIGWKVSIILQVAVGLVALYGLARALYGPRVAVLALGMLAPAHYLLAYDHTGYANIETLTPAVLALFFLVIGAREGSRLLLTLSGVCAALGWYTYYPSRTTIFIVAASVLFAMRPQNWLRVGIPLLAGFALLFLPLFIVNGSDIVSAMLSQSGQGGSSEVVANRSLLPLYNSGRSFLAFNYNEHDGPYLCGSLAEPITALLLLLGIARAFATWGDRRSRLLLVWFFFSTITCGVLSKYDYVSVSRLNYLLPIVVLLAALAADQAIEVCRAWVPRRLAWYFTALAVTVVLGASGFSNLHRWFVETPGNYASTPDALAVRAISEPR